MFQAINQAKVIYLSFFYLSSYMEAARRNNQEVPPKIKKLFTKVSKVISLYSKNRKFLQDLLQDVKKIVEDFPDKKLDLLLASVTILIEYYEQTRGSKRLFCPINIKNAASLQCEIADTNNGYIEDTFEYCSFVVEKLLRGVS